MGAHAFQYKGLDVLLIGSINEMYDDNITYTKEDQRDDFITNLILGLGVRYEGKTKTLELIGHTNQEIFSKYHNLNNNSQDLYLHSKNELSRLGRLSLTNVFNHYTEPRSFEYEFGRTAGRYSYYRNRFDITYSRDVSKWLVMNARYFNEINEVTRDYLNDSITNGAGVKVDYSLSYANILSILYDFTYRKFDDGEAVYVHTGAFNYRHYFTSQLYFECQSGLDFIKVYVFESYSTEQYISESYYDKNYTKPLILASLVDEIDKNSRFILLFSKRYYPNIHSEDLSNYWKISCVFERQLLKRLWCSFSAFYGDGEYVFSDTIYKLKGIRTSFSYDLKENLKGSLKYAYTQSESTEESNEYVKNRVLLELTTEF